MVRRGPLLFLLLTALLSSMLISVLVGPAGTPFLDLGREVASTIVLSVRLPRAIAAALVGTGLAASGVVMQGLFRNSMADPYLLGTSSGGALGAAFAIVFLNGALHWVFAFLGCIAAIALVYAIAVRGGRVPVEQLLLTGIAVSVFLSAILSFLMYTSGKSLHQIFLWLMGGFWSISWSDVWIGALILPASLALLLFSRELNIFSMGEEDALHLGVETESMKRGLLLASAFITGISVAIAGSIGFIGLITPHLMRLVTGPDHRFLLPGAMMAGGVLLVLSDTLARTAGGEVPVGVITAFFGAPFFIFLLKRRYAL